MHKLLILLLIPTICFAYPKFRYKQCVVIKEGFYRDCRGLVESFEEILRLYDVQLLCHDSNKIVTLKEDNLRECN